MHFVAFGACLDILGTLNTTFSISNVNVEFFFCILWFFHILEVLLSLQNIFEQNWPKTQGFLF